MTPGANGGQTGPPPTYQPAGKIWQTGEYTYVDPHGTVWHGTSGEMRAQASRDATVHTNAPPNPNPPGGTSMTEDEMDRACEWSDYRKSYGVSAKEMTAAHKAFCAGWDAARGYSHEEGSLR